MYRKRLGYVGFSTICGFRYPFGVLDGCRSMHGCQKMMKGQDEAEFLASYSRGKLGGSRVLLLHSVFVSGAPQGTPRIRGDCRRGDVA